MAQIEKMEVQVDVKSSAERFFQTYQSKQYLLPKICPNLVKDLRIIKGDWESVGSVRQWTFVPGSELHTNTIIDEAIDKKNKSFSCKVLDGEALKHYKSYKYTTQVTGKSVGDGSSVKTIMEYEHHDHNENAQADPKKYGDFAILVFKAVDDYLMNNNA